MTQNFLKEYKAVIIFNDAKGPDHLFKELGEAGALCGLFGARANDPMSSKNSVSMRLYFEGLTPKLEITGHSLNDIPDFGAYFHSLKDDQTLRIESIEITTPSKGRTVA